MLSDDERQLVQKLTQSALKGYAEIKLTKLRPEVVDELVCTLASETTTAHTTHTTPPLPLTSHAEKVAHLLEVKKQLQKRLKCETKRQASPPTPPAPPAPPTPPTPPAPLERSAAPLTPPGKVARPRDVFKTAHEIHIVAFNSLKLRLDHEELREEWSAAVLEFARYDVLLLSEVRASDKLYKARATRLLQMLNESTEEEEWAMRSSVPSGPGAPEVHLVLAKKPVEILECTTLETLGGLKMDHAPFVCLLEDKRFVGEVKRFNVVSVHFPPAGQRARRAERDAQIRKLLSTYPIEAAARLHSPFTDQAAKEQRKKAPYVAHIIGGDFNADAKELRNLEAEKHGFEVVLGSVRTSASGKSYDNWLINREAKDRLTIGADILDLSRFANFSAGRQGISDHAPIALRLTEVPAAPAAPTARV